MPHIHLEYSTNLPMHDVKSLLLALNQALLDGRYVESGNEIKSRAVPQSDFVIGVAGDAQGYVHAKVSLLSGRDESTQVAISKQVLQTLEKHFHAPAGLTVQLCVEIIEMPRNGYSKSVVNG